jgi:outer membrane protein
MFAKYLNKETRMSLGKVLGLISILVLITTKSFAAADMKIAVVDLQKALQTVDAGKKAKSSLEKEFNEKKKTLQAEETALKKMKEDWDKQSAVLSEEAKMKKQGEMQERWIKYRELFSKSQMDIQARERELTDPIIGKLKVVVDDVGAKKGYSIIFEKNDSSVLFLQQKDDLTEEVIAAFNKKNG